MEMTNVRKSIALEAIYKSGQYLLSVFGSDVSFYEKSAGDMVSEADKTSERILIDCIKSRCPEDGILSEECGKIEGASGYIWILDPLDGTHNFLNKLPHFGVLAALYKEGSAVSGFCYFPALDMYFFTEKNFGSFLNGKRISVCGAKDLKNEMFFSDGVLRKKPKEILGDIENFCSRGCRLRVCGSAPFAFLMVACGNAAVATNRLCKPWDVAAPALIVEEAGGMVSDENGKPWNLEAKNLIATNKILHKQSLDAMFK
ncbi:MAG: inositol monophosphatase [Patescibacteria group bacterium]